jgi:hypothetical protein
LESLLEVLDEKSGKDIIIDFSAIMKHHFKALPQSIQ